MLVKENGGQDLWAYFWPYYQVVSMPGVGVAPAEETAMGYGVVGAMAARRYPDRQVVCTIGDGAFQMQLHEMGTAVQQGLAVTWVVLDDSAFGWVQWIQKRTESPIMATQFAPATDLVASARAAEIEALRVERADDLRRALQGGTANAAGRPFVVVAPVDQSHHHAEFDRFHGFEPAFDSATA